MMAVLLVLLEERERAAFVIRPVECGKYVLWRDTSTAGNMLGENLLFVIRVNDSIFITNSCTYL